MFASAGAKYGAVGMLAAGAVGYMVGAQKGGQFGAHIGFEIDKGVAWVAGVAVTGIMIASQLAHLMGIGWYYSRNGPSMAKKEGVREGKISDEEGFNRSIPLKGSEFEDEFNKQMLELHGDTLMTPTLSDDEMMKYSLDIDYYIYPGDSLDVSYEAYYRPSEGRIYLTQNSLGNRFDIYHENVHHWQWNNDKIGYLLAGESFANYSESRFYTDVMYYRSSSHTYGEVYGWGKRRTKAIDRNIIGAYFHHYKYFPDDWR